MLTKSNYLLGLQCPKFLWITKHAKERIPEPDRMAQAKFKAGNMIGVFATKVFENGINLSGMEFQENLDKTEESLKLRKPIFEASVLVDNLFSRADNLLPVGIDEWDIIEVKSSTDVKDISIQDVSFQKYVCEKSKIKIRHCILMHVNNENVKDGNIEPKDFFFQSDITEKVEEILGNVKRNIDKMMKNINGPEPDFSIEDILTIKYDNVCLEEFMRNLPEENVFEFFRMFKTKRVELYKEGHIKMVDVPEDIKLNDKQKIQRRLAFDKDTHINKQEIKNFLGNLKYPIYYLDFETINPVIPKFDGMKPYQRIPFQFSLHIQEKSNEKLKHISFLAEGTSDPRPKFMQALKDNLAKKGSILVYNQAFEKGVMRECSDALPEFKEWYEENILPRIRDLWDIFKDFSYYDPRQKGSTSLKAILPLLSDLDYSEMDINHGMLASIEYERITYSQVEESERLKVREALEKYCEMDTMAEVKIVEGLGKK